MASILAAAPAFERTPEGRAVNAARKLEKAKEEAATFTAETEAKRSGKHCLSGWDGSHRALVEEVKSRLRNPASFEHIETTITPVNKDGPRELASRGS